MLLLITERILIMSSTETTNNMFKDVWLAHKESWLENLERYQKIKNEMANKFETDISYFENEHNWKQMQVIENDILICNMQITICDNQIKIAELKQDNLKLKVGINDS